MQRRSKNYGISDEVQPAEDKWAVLVRHSNRTFSPPTDVIELADKLLVVIEIAGVRSSDLDITLLERHLVIRGLRKRSQHPNPAYHQVEIAYGEFRIEVMLPWTVNRDSVSATYESGFLQIELPRKPARNIRIVDNNEAE
jgi:HSP20 family protein